MRCRWVFPAFALLLATPPAFAAPPAQPDSTLLAQVLRDLLLKNLPDPLLTDVDDWGDQKDVVTGLKWRREGKLRLKAERQHGLRNDGHWERLTVRAIDPPRTLALGIRHLTYPEPGKMTFEAMLGVDVRLTYEQQLWKSGVRLYGGETRARCRAALRLVCEVTNRLEKKPGALLPDAILRVRVTEAQLFYTDLVCEHTAGLDGPAAKAVGEAIHNLIRKVKPAWEKDLLTRANAAIVKAADTRDVRIELDRLLAGKAPAVTRQSGK